MRRIFSVLSILPYFGMLLPALKEMVKLSKHQGTSGASLTTFKTKDLIKFLGLTAILYLVAAEAALITMAKSSGVDG